MTCCKPLRVSAGLGCARPRQLCCAWHHADWLAEEKGLRGLDAFARHLLDFWPLCDVYWVFAAAGQMSALAVICRERWLQMPDQTARAAYRAEVAAATQAYREVAGPPNAAAFVATFDVLCEAASVRP
jgi:hypothetical protein